MEYYQISGDDESSSTASEPLKKRELKAGHMEGSHSPFGFIWQIVTATGWSYRRILWKIPYPTLLMMLKDAPKYVTEDKKKNINRKNGSSHNALDFFQTQLTNNDKPS